MSEMCIRDRAEGNAVADVPLHIKRLIFIFIESAHIGIRQLTGAFNIDRGAVEHLSLIHI